MAAKDFSANGGSAPWQAVLRSYLRALLERMDHDAEGPLLRMPDAAGGSTSFYRVHDFGFRRGQRVNVRGSAGVDLAAYLASRFELQLETGCSASLGLCLDAQKEKWDTLFYQDPFPSDPSSCLRQIDSQLFQGGAWWSLNFFSTLPETPDLSQRNGDEADPSLNRPPFWRGLLKGMARTGFSRILCIDLTSLARILAWQFLRDELRHRINHESAQEPKPIIPLIQDEARDALIFLSRELLQGRICMRLVGGTKRLRD